MLGGNAAVRDIWAELADSTAFSRPQAGVGAYRTTAPSSYFLTTAHQAAWLPQVKRQLAELSSRPPNWDSYGGSPLSAAMRAAASALIEQIADPGLPMPTIVPTSDGSVQFEWHEHDIDLELRLRSPSVYELYFEDASGTSPPKDEELRYDLTPLRDALEILRTR